MYSSDIALRSLVCLLVASPKGIDYSCGCEETTWGIGGLEVEDADLSPSGKLPIIERLVCGAGECS